jgi:hypothetical protein
MGLPWVEIAETLGRTEKAVTNLYYRGCKRLRLLLTNDQ